MDGTYHNPMMKRFRILHVLLLCVLLSGSVHAAFHYHPDGKTDPECQICLYQQDARHADPGSVFGLRLAPVQPDHPIYAVADHRGSTVVFPVPPRSPPVLF